MSNQGYEPHEFKPFHPHWYKPRCKVCSKFEDHQLHQTEDNDAK